MVVNTRAGDAPALDLGHLALFLGMRVNQVVVDAMRRRGFQHVRESHGYVIQHLIDAERSISELAQRMEVTQQAASKFVAELGTIGAVEVIAGPDKRSKVVRLSARGWESVHAARKARRDVERKLIQLLGHQEYDAAKAVLSRCLEKLGGTERIRSRRVPAPE